LGSLLKICHATKLIGIPPRAITGDHPDFGKQERTLASKNRFWQEKMSNKTEFDWTAGF
jgi:hypothetical protein